MRAILKSLLDKSPLVIRKNLIFLNESYVSAVSQIKETLIYGTQNEVPQQKRNIKNILVYHIDGLSFGGTEKNLQVIANNLSSDYTVYFMCSNQTSKVSRKDSLAKEVTIIDFTYSKQDKNHPYFIYGMSPHIKEVIIEHAIDLLITTSSGHSEYPFNTIKKIPIILINVFGSPSLQENIVATIFVSKTVMKHSEYFTGARKNNIPLFVPLSLPPKNIIENSKKIRTNFNFKDTDFIFGRIGRNSDSIFDPIALTAFKKIVEYNSSAHFLIMSPPPKATAMVEEEEIRNVHFLSPSADDKDIWGFHYAIDALAHFRLDGETFGLNIAESMYAGNPIISHESNIWNAHTDYLDPSFSRVAKNNDIEMYASYMNEFIQLKNESPMAWNEMKKRAHDFAYNNFSEELYMKKIRTIITNLHEDV